jgi:hypothetical protein
VIAPSFEAITYLGFRIIVLDERDLSIYTPEGRLIFTGRMAMSTARRVVRGHRKGD